MSNKEQKEYSVWGVMKDKPIHLLLDGDNYMPFEIALEKVFKYIGSLNDTSEWKEVAPKGLETMRWENRKDDRILISEIIQVKIMNSN